MNRNRNENYIHIATDDLIVCYKGKEHSFMELYRKMDTKVNAGTLWLAFITAVLVFYIFPLMESRRVLDKIENQNNKIENQNNKIESQSNKIESQNNKIRDLELKIHEIKIKQDLKE